MWLRILARHKPWSVVTIATIAVAVIAVVDRKIDAQVPLALLYILPAALAGISLTRWQVPIFGVFCTLVAELADAFPWSLAQGIPRDALYFAAYTAAGLYVSEVLSRRQLELEHLRAVEVEAEARQHAEEQLRLLVSTSSIAIVTSDREGMILHANEAAERLLSSNAGGWKGEISRQLKGQSLAHFVPALARASTLGQGTRQLKTMMQCQGMRADREPFFADVWFSTYTTTEGPRVTAMIIDSSKELRDREEANLEQVLNGSRLLVGAVSHEIRNICAAIALVLETVQQNLSVRSPEVDLHDDFQALRQLTSTLERLSSVELSHVKRLASRVHLGSFLRDLRIVVGPSLRESGVAVEWEQQDNLPTVWADPQSLLQVFLNLIRNSEAALEDQPDPRLSVTIAHSAAHVQIRITDNGPGVANPEILFHPFRTSKTGVQPGFGLYLSKAMVASFRGELRYEPSSRGAVFIVELLSVDPSSPAAFGSNHEPVSLTPQ
jgi:C4-dicarboxylate-specific signal transduction histidine kinase